METRWSRLPVVVTMVAVACGALIGIVLLTPVPGMLLVDQALSRLHRQYGIVGAVGRVDLDLAQFRVSPTDLRFAAGDQGAAPFLTIDDVHIGGETGVVALRRLRRGDAVGGGPRQRQARRVGRVGRGPLA